MGILAAVGTAAAAAIVGKLIDGMDKKSGYVLKLSNQYYPDALASYTVVSRSGRPGNPADPVIHKCYEEGWTQMWATGVGCTGVAIWTHDKYDVMTGWRSESGAHFAYLYCDVAAPGTWRLTDGQVLDKFWRLKSDYYTRDRMERTYGGSVLVGALGKPATGLWVCEYTHLHKDKRPRCPAPVVEDDSHQ